MLSTTYVHLIGHVSADDTHQHCAIDHDACLVPHHPVRQVLESFDVSPKIWGFPITPSVYRTVKGLAVTLFTSFDVAVFSAIRARL